MIYALLIAALLCSTKLLAKPLLQKTRSRHRVAARRNPSIEEDLQKSGEAHGDGESGTREGDGLASASSGNGLVGRDTSGLGGVGATNAC